MSQYMNQIKGAAGMVMIPFVLGTCFKSAVYYVEPGHRAFLFNKVSGVKENNIVREGWNLKLPYFERPIIYDVRTHPK